MWKAQKINDNDMKKVQLFTVLQDRALAWYIKYSTTNPNVVWLQRYLYIEEHKILFSLFPCELHEWLFKLANNEPTLKHDDPIVWTPELIKHLEKSNHKVVRCFDYWIDSILGSFITKIAIDT